ncbi:ABC transporter permease [Pilimelia columellifera]|uniref:Nickel ABC transporter permease subunit NikB n=1 Tax=Pilimelia columellifera subsp. columellifera TaxID=706583 RepID=A0ABP6B3E9_9ACTN
MIIVIARRVGQAVATLAVGSVLVWSLLALAPGDPARRVLATNNVTSPTAAQVTAKRVELGLSGQPVARYGRWLAGAARGDLGTSWVTGRPVRHELGSRLPATLRLTAAAVALALGVALLLGCVAASAPGRWPDLAIRLAALPALVLPSFVVGLVLLQVVVLRLAQFRVISDGSWSTVFLPALTLALATAATWSRILRAGLLQARGAPHVEVARARGAGRARLLLVHDLPNALVPFLTVVGAGVAALLGGAPIVETVFTWPGVGRFAVQGITSRDLPVVQGYALLGITAYVAVSLVVDLIAMAVDPRTAPASTRRVRLSRSGR